MKKKILVIDDEDDIRKLMYRILTGQGYEVYLAINGLDALEKIDSLMVDLIILDMNMPKMNGLQFLRSYQDNIKKHVPVLMVSGSSDEQQRVESYKLGVYDYITKPEHAEVMLKRIENGIKIGEMKGFNDFIKIELMMAKKLQKYLFPASSLETSHVEIKTWSKPLADIGGDLYDYITFRDGRLIFFVADVTGHSISAALFTAIVKMVFRNALKITEQPGGILSIMNRELSGNLPIETFVTMFCGLINPNEKTMTYANAGHPSPFILRENQVIELKKHDSFLGPIREAIYKNWDFPLEPGDYVFLYTDGIIELMDEEENEVGRDVLMEILYNSDLTPMNKYQRIKDEIRHTEYEVMDDCTLMMVKYKG